MGNINRLLNVLYWLISLYLLWAIDLPTLHTVLPADFLFPLDSYLHVSVSELKNSDPFDLDKIKLYWRVFNQSTTSLFQTQMTF